MLSARSCSILNILDNVPTTPATDNYSQTQGQRSIIPSSDSETHTLGNASAGISFDVVENLLDLSLDPVLVLNTWPTPTSKKQKV
jgi:hypothetical protein